VPPLNRRQTGFLVRFFGLLILFYVVVTPVAVDEAVIKPFTRGLAAVSAAALNAIGQDVTLAGTVIHNSAFAVDIQNGCNGVEALVFLCAAIFAFEAPLRARILGVLAGAVAVQALNIIRIASLFLLGRYRRDLFETFHLGVWQTLIFGAAVGIFIFWTRRFGRAGAVAAS
jgi:exosortase H (IPTLxxWG-CTERM-specific)